VIFRHQTTASFWEHYNRLPEELRERADKQFALLNENPRHPSIQLKPVGEFWSARVSDDYRVLALREGAIFTWFWIGPHNEYGRLISERNRGTA